MVQVIVSSAGAGCLQRWVLLELQGDVEPRGGGELPGSLLGDLHYTREVVQLEKPFAVLMKQAADPAGTRYAVTALIKTKLLFKTRPKPIITNVPKKV
ncbi:chromosome transmission fidelity protein 8 homolog isoform X2 [Coturnix japonica]|uniref:chromosome transmission fidelity protein 8 homolog isoform X2 n=1 Tax=Coturnix japonica TaxID=93934 RepID=UPI0007775062|nr:chromosome transmission fidelity protein 8 homolog isoform X2 [Coturnix japonica]